MASSSSSSSTFPWPPYKDCTQEICSIYCPQRCLLFPPPPPPSFDLDDYDSGGPDFSPLIIALIGILASAFILICYYTIISRFWRRRGRNDNSWSSSSDHQLNENGGEEERNNERFFPGSGLDEALIKSRTVCCKYKKGDFDLVQGTDCSVCLNEFQDDESLRLLSKCNHAFHLPCIDTWFKSHSSCPLCRANINDIAAAAAVPAAPDHHQSQSQPQQQTVSAASSSALEYYYQHTSRRRNDVILVIQDRHHYIHQTVVSVGQEIDTTVVVDARENAPKMPDSLLLTYYASRMSWRRKNKKKKTKNSIEFETNNIHHQV